MLKAMTWARWVKKVMEILPIEKDSQYIKDIIVMDILGSVEKQIPKIELYEQAGCILSEDFCRSINKDAAIEDAPIPELNAIAKKAEVLLKPVKKPRAINQPKKADPELADTYDQANSIVMSEEVKTMQAKIDAEREASIKKERTFVQEPNDSVYGLPASKIAAMNAHIDGCDVAPVVKKPSKKKKAKTVVPVTSLADKASELLSSDADYDNFKSHMVDVLDGINKGNTDAK